MNRKLVFWTALNSYQSPKLLRHKPPGTTHPAQTAEWTERRVDLFKRFTLPSILNQRYEDFLYIVLLNPDLKHLTKPLLPSHPDERVIYCYKDRPVLDRLREYDSITLALIDGDDMYSRDAGTLLISCLAEWMYFRLGYAYDVFGDELWIYDTIGTGPFFARRIDPKKMTSFDREKRHPTHVDVINRCPAELPEGNFCVVLHDRNTSSHPQMRHIRKSRPVDKNILSKEFGL